MVQKVSFEELMFTAIDATQDTFSQLLGVDVLAGKVRKEMEPINADVVGIVGIGWERVGYVIFSVDKNTAFLLASKLLGMEPEDDMIIRDAVGELINIVAGTIKSKYERDYGSVGLGLPLILSGTMIPCDKNILKEKQEELPTVKVQSKSVLIPFKSFDIDISFYVMIYM